MHNEDKKKRTNEWTGEHTNGQTKYEKYIPRRYKILTDVINPTYEYSV